LAKDADKPENPEAFHAGGGEMAATAQSALEALNANLLRRLDEATHKLVANEALIQTFFEHSSECYAILAEADGGHFRYLEINPATLRLYAKSRTEVVGRLTVEVVGPEMGARLDRHMAACLRSGLPYRYERIQGKGAVEAVATPVPTQPGAPRRVVVSARDVTEQRRLEEQLRQAQKMEAIGQLTGGLAHDFNNLLAGISGSLELAQRRRTEDRLDDLDRYVDVARGAARRAATLTQRLLAFSRRQTLDPRPTNVNRIVAGMEDQIRRTVGPSIDVEFIGGSRLWPALVDASQLDSALLNLCINARDAMPDGGRLTLETANKRLDDRAAATLGLDPGECVSLCVTDTGVGMAPEIVARIFDPFFTTKPLGEGTGLGLSMVYGFTRQSGGQVRVASEVGKGTTICLYLPRHNEEAADEESDLTSPPAAAIAQKQTILLIEDEPTVRMFIADVLDEAGYNVVEARDGAGALKVLQSPESLCLVITDIGLPGGMNGRQVAEAGRALRPGLKMLFITGYAENSVLNNKHIEPGTRVLTKPFAVDDLTRIVGELIAGG
jgi:PAS domain S-box-containing protein